MATFNPTIPKPSDFLSTSQGQLLSNNTSLDASFGVDHTLFSDTTTNKGRHKQVNLYQVAADPTLTFPQSMLYSKNTGTTPNQTTNLYYGTKPETGSASYFQMTNLPFVNVGAGNTGTAGGTMNYMDTPWGLRLYFGVTNAFSGGNKTVIFSTPFSILVMASGIANTAAGNVSTTALEGTSQLHFGTDALVPVNWFALGRL